MKYWLQSALAVTIRHFTDNLALAIAFFENAWWFAVKSLKPRPPINDRPVSLSFLRQKGEKWRSEGLQNRQLASISGLDKPIAPQNTPITAKHYFRLPITSLLRWEIVARIPIVKTGADCTVKPRYYDGIPSRPFWSLYREYRLIEVFLGIVSAYLSHWSSGFSDVGPRYCVASVASSILLPR